MGKLVLKNEENYFIIMMISPKLPLSIPLKSLNTYLVSNHSLFDYFLPRRGGFDSGERVRFSCGRSWVAIGKVWFFQY